MRKTAPATQEWPADRVERRLTARLVPYANNARTHSDAQVAQLVASIREWGWTVPVLIDEAGGIIAGHGRVLAAQSMGLADVPVMTVTGWTEAQKAAYVLADNRLALNAGWDPDMLRLELTWLDSASFDLSLAGFAEDELRDLLANRTAGLTDPDDVPEPPAVPVTALGDVWLLGKHRVMCGDSTNIDSVELLMGGVKADFCFTSPPYNAAIKLGGRFGSNQGKGFYSDGYNDSLESSNYVQFNMDVISSIVCVASDCFTLCYNINYNKNSPSEYIDVIAAAKRVLPLVETIVWEKAMAVSLQGDNLTRIYEFIFVLAKGKFKINKNRTDCLKNIWKISNIGANHENHKACFPVALAEEGIKNFCPHGGVVIEPFGGAGSSVIAAEKLDCSAYAMELDPKYCDVIVERWQRFTGQQATLEGDGRTFQEVTHERQP